MKRIVKFSELSSIEYNQVSNFLYGCINDSLMTCINDCKSFYKTIELSDYENSLIIEIWNDNDECIGEGFSAIAFDVIVDDKESLMSMFNDARDKVWEDFIEEICESDEDCDELDEPKCDDDIVAMDTYDEDASMYQGFGDMEVIYNDVIKNGGTTRQFANYFGFTIYDNKELQQLEVYKK